MRACLTRYSTRTHEPRDERAIALPRQPQWPGGRVRAFSAGALGVASGFPLDSHARWVGGRASCIRLAVTYYTAIASNAQPIATEPP